MHVCIRVLQTAAHGLTACVCKHSFIVRSHAPSLTYFWMLLVYSAIDSIETDEHGLDTDI